MPPTIQQLVSDHWWLPSGAPALCQSVASNNTVSEYHLLCPLQLTVFAAALLECRGAGAGCGQAGAAEPCGCELQRTGRGLPAEVPPQGGRLVCCLCPGDAQAHLWSQ